jgi:predicted aspartyl protease
MQGLHFLVDTGAYPSVIDLPIARSLGLAEQPRRVNLSNKSVRTRLVTLPSLRLGSVHVESLPVLTEDLSFMRNALGYKVDAIIGLDILGKSSFTIDFPSKQMYQGAVERMAFSAPFATGVPIVTIQTKFQGQPLRLAVDTGAPGLLLFQSRVPGAIAFREVGRERVADVSGSFESRKVRIPSVFLGNEPIGAQIASVVDDRKDAGDNFDGILGMREPRFSSIAFDFQRGAFFWELSNHR